MARRQKNAIFVALELEIASAEFDGKSIFIELDANSKLGPGIIPQDPHNQTPNGRILAGIIERHALVVINGVVNKCKKVEEELVEKYADTIHDKIKEEIAGIKCEEGGINSGHLWRLKNKLSSKFRDPPTPMKDDEGNLETNVDKVKELAVNNFKNVLENRPMKDHLKHIQKEREELCRKRLEEAKKNKTPQWINWMLS